MDINKEAEQLAKEIIDLYKTEPVEWVCFENGKQSILQSFERICREQREKDIKYIENLTPFSMWKLLTDKK